MAQRPAPQLPQPPGQSQDPVELPQARQKDAWQAEREQIESKHAAERARLAKRLTVDKNTAQDSYNENHNLILELDTRYYGSLLLCLKENLQMKQQLAEMEYNAHLYTMNSDHEQELQAHSEKWKLEGTKDSAAAPSSIPSPISAIPQEHSRSNSIVESVEDVTQSLEGPSLQPTLCPIPDEQQQQPSQGQHSSENKLHTTVSPPDTTDLPNAVPPNQAESTKKRVADEVPGYPSKRVKENVNDIKDGPKKKQKKSPRAESTTDSKPLTKRTVSFEQVTNDPLHHDTIVRYPINTGPYYILYCEEHQLHFRHKSPIGGAAKHLHGSVHGEMPKDWELAIRHLGYLVTGCDEEKRQFHNRKVQKHFDNGGSVARGLKKSVKKAPPVVSTKPKPSSSSSSAEMKAKLLEPASPQKIRGVVYPKNFHIYQARWGTGHGATFYPVMILGWDSQYGSGLAGTLNDTLLLDKQAEPPRCYVYDSAMEKIIGWQSDFEDGGPRVGSRKFPVLFFDSKKSAAWISGRDLRKYPLYDEITEVKELRKQQEVRRWIARREGFSTWEQRQAARGVLDAGETDRTTAVTVPAPAPLAHASSSTYQQGSPSVATEQNDTDNEQSGVMDLDDTDSSLDCETLYDAELRRLLEIGGEVPGDKDYTDSQETGDGDVEMAGDSPSKVYRKSFITTRSSDRCIAAPASASQTEIPPAHVSANGAGQRSCDEDLGPGTSRAGESPHEAVQDSLRPGHARAGDNNQTVVEASCADVLSHLNTALSQAHESSTRAHTLQSTPAEQLANTSIPPTEKITGSFEPETASEATMVQVTPSTSANHDKQTQPPMAETALGAATLATSTAVPRATPMNNADNKISPKLAPSALSHAAPPPFSASKKSLAGTDQPSAKGSATAIMGHPRPSSNTPTVEPVMLESVDGHMGANSNDPTATNSTDPERDMQRAKLQTVTQESEQNSRPPSSRPSPAETARGVIEALPTQRRDEPYSPGSSSGMKLESNRVPSVSHMPPIRTTSFGIARESIARDTASVSSATASPVMSTSALARAEFTVQMYSRGAVQWEKTAPEVASIKMIADGGVLRSLPGSAVTIAIEPSRVRMFVRQSSGFGNYKMVLMPVAEGEDVVHIVFGPGVGCRGESGKKQSRRFVQWMQSVNSKLEALQE